MSLHGEKNYPFRKIPSHMDIPLPTGTTDEEYLNALAVALTNVSAVFDYDMIFYQAGVDVLKEDSLGTFGLSLEGIMRRDQMVFSFAKSKPLAMAIGGGYAKPIQLTVEAHVNTFKTAKNFYG